MNFTNLKNKIENNYLKYFKKSKCKITEYNKNNITQLFIRLYIAKDTTELGGKYWENDMFNIVLHIRIKNNFEISAIDTAYLIKGKKNYKRKKTYFKTYTGTEVEILKKLESYYKRLYKNLLKDYNQDKIHDDFKTLVSKKLEV